MVMKNELYTESLILAHGKWRINGLNIGGVPTATN